MLGENDGPSMLSYATSGASYGLGFFLPFILMTFSAAYVVQEIAMRVGAVTGRGYGELVFQRFGRLWGWVSVGDLVVTNFLTLITEVIAIRIGMGFFGIPAWGAVLCAVSLVAVGSWGARYSRWERLCAGLAVFNAAFISVAYFAHPSVESIAVSMATWSPFPKTEITTFLMLVVSNIGATVTPWMLFFQQSATVDKGLTTKDIARGRANTALGAILAAITGCAAFIGATPLFDAHVDMSQYLQGTGFAQALEPLTGSASATLFALGLIEAGAIAMLTISASSAYAVGEIVQGVGASFNLSPKNAPVFHLTNVGIAALAGIVVLIPGVPLMAIALNANLLATILMPAALVFLLILSNDPEVMGRNVNKRACNLLSVGIAAFVTLAGCAYAIAGFLESVGITITG